MTNQEFNNRLERINKIKKITPLMRVRAFFVLLGVVVLPIGLFISLIVVLVMGWYNY